jgi:hypothetical protein
MSWHKDPSELVIQPGDRFGRLTIVKRLYKVNHVKWTCLCDCGKEVDLLQAALQGSRPQKSCGCLRDEKIRYKDLHKGDKFGMLTLVEETRKRVTRSSSKSGFMMQRAWVCQCECGNQSTVVIGHLLHGSSRSCGCNTYNRSQRVRKEGFTIYHKAPHNRPSPRMIKAVKEQNE